MTVDYVVRTTGGGWPLPSARCSLVVSPPRLRPSASSVHPPLVTRSGCMLVRTHGRAIYAHLPDHVSDRVGCGLNVGQQRVPRPISLPALKSRADGPSGTISLGQVAPRRPGPQLPEGAVDDLTVVTPRLPSPPVRRQQRRQFCPCSIREFLASNRPAASGPQPKTGRLSGAQLIHQTRPRAIQASRQYDRAPLLPMVFRGARRLEGHHTHRAV